jgi:hypothetical protein
MRTRLVIFAAVVLAVLMAGTGLYATGQPSEPVIVRHQTVGEYQPGDPEYVEPPPRRPGVGLGIEWDYNKIIEPVYDDAPLSILRSGTATWWFFGAGAVLVLAVAAVVLLPGVRRR